MKQHQVRKPNRAPHGSPQYSRQCGGWVTEEQWEWLRQRGMSITLRELVQQAMEKEQRYGSNTRK